MVEVMRRFPVIEDLVAVLYGREKGGEQTGSEEDIECAYGREAIGGSFGVYTGRIEPIEPFRYF